MFPVELPAVWAGREKELAVLHAATEAASQGRGSVLWVEGEAGIGKSSLVAAGLTNGGSGTREVLWGTADQLSHRFPLRVMLDCLQVRPRSPDPRRARIADFLRDRRPGLFAADDVAYTATEMLVSLVDELCTDSPTVLVLDDLQWADEASLMLWHRLALAVEELPLLLVSATRPVPIRQDVQTLRAATLRRGGTLLPLGALGPDDVRTMITGVLGAPPGPALDRLLGRAMGNPLYLRELLDALAREQTACAALTGGELSDDALERVPASFAGALTDRLSVVSAATAQMLRTASLLGGEFAVTDLAAVLRRTASDLAEGLQNAVAAGIVIGVGDQLAFRHPLIRQALYDSMPAALRAALHCEAAKTLAGVGAEPLRVAQQLLAAGHPGDEWTHTWVVEAAPALAARAPDIAAELLQRELETSQLDRADQAALSVELARVLLNAGRHPEAADRARQALTMVTQPGHRAEMSSIMARTLFSQGRNEEALDVLSAALARPDIPAVWQARLLASLSMFKRASGGHLGTADSTAREALRVGEEAGDAFAVAYALTDLWLTHSVRRDHDAALGYVDRALTVLSDAPEHTDLRTFAFDGRIFTLQNLDRWPEAEATMRRARELGQRVGGPGQGVSTLTAAVLLYWLGRWDDALAELDVVERDSTTITYSGLRERGPALLWHGVAALIAGRRGANAAAAEHLRAGLALPVRTVADRENRDFLLAARALAAEQEGEPARALSLLSAVLERGPGEMTLLHQWAPELVRLAVATDDRPAALAALRACQAETAAESQPGRAAAALRRCQGLLDGDPAPLREAVAYYRSVGSPVELTGTLEDLAAVLAERDEQAEARTLLGEAVDRYDALGAVWDIRRAERRLRRLGVRRGVRGPRPARAQVGWEALTPTEARVTALVAEGRSTPDIARELYLSRRTVQTHISHILGKLGVRSRVEIAREALRRGASGTDS
ncbi:BTAD domain-containing putative transcriptional regulator [Plantactinospora mayteni]|uniref:SARP family transcriptional regulator n=1 Tax=Plantactinospora mayteni TaxID=566021 RepID=A0ABQ4EGY4_9ACTN|nr:LuxR family transcriptional regulator [Plantactinospora mayteni]GIG93482.1 SARP family transcriptional regulator [Plantactinospora mayteni]